jgi:hypothetical protein
MQQPLGEDDLVVQGLLSWFKRSFFTWVRPACLPACRRLWGWPHEGWPHEL